MSEFRVWAPFPDEVKIVIDEKQHRMEKKEKGWWQIDLPQAKPGTDYAFVLDNSKPLPDPRSPWQPHGVHGSSRTVDHNKFDWTDDAWRPPPLSSAVIYELHVGTFTPEGTFEAIIDKLDYLIDLGVTHIELMPVNEFPGSRGWGYDGVDLYAPHHAYGGPDGLKRLIDACHGKEVAVLLDVVYNHLGPAGNYLGQFGPYFTDRYQTPWGEAVNLDGAGSDQVRRFFTDNAVMWLRDYHFDGLRIDAVHAFLDHSATHFLEELAVEVEKLEANIGRPLTLIAESDLNDPRIIRPQEIGGYGLHAQWNEDAHHALHAVLTGEKQGYYADFGSVADLAKALKQAFVYDGRYSKYRDRRHGKAPTGLSGHHFVGCLQNHDQVGNRAKGDRIGMIVNSGRQKIGAALVLTSPFVPMLFQGEEWSASTPFCYFTDHEEELGNLVREGRRNEFAAFGWNPEDIPDPQSEETFQRSKLDWAELDKSQHAEMRAWYRDLIALRKKYSCLTDGNLDNARVDFSEKEQWLILRRDPIWVVLNLARKTQAIIVPDFQRMEVVLASNDRTRSEPNGIKMPANSVSILALT